MIQLYQFPVSHFCEKARWGLDYKGVPWTAVNLLPGPHVGQVRKRFGAALQRASVPILVHGDQVVQGSGAILTWLDHTWPERRLTPTQAQDASLVLEWEKYLDQSVGVPIRLWSYQHVLPQRALALHLLAGHAPWWSRSLYRLAWPKIAVRMRAAMKIDAAHAEAALQQMEWAFDRLDQALDGRDWLVGNQFTRADLTACALLGSLCRPGAGDGASAGLPPGLVWPDAILRLRERQQGRRWQTWATQVWATRRRGPPGAAAGA